MAAMRMIHDASDDRIESMALAIGRSHPSIFIASAPWMTSLASRTRSSVRRARDEQQRGRDASQCRQEPQLQRHHQQHHAQLERACHEEDPKRHRVVKAPHVVGHQVDHVAGAHVADGRRVKAQHLAVHCRDDLLPHDVPLVHADPENLVVQARHAKAACTQRDRQQPAAPGVGVAALVVILQPQKERAQHHGSHQTQAHLQKDEKQVGDEARAVDGDERAECGVERAPLASSLGGMKGGERGWAEQ
eukprot:130806-Chlamydomonas_euryale.AAC.13